MQETSPCDVVIARAPAAKSERALRFIPFSVLLALNVAGCGAPGGVAEDLSAPDEVSVLTDQAPLSVTDAACPPGTAEIVRVQGAANAATMAIFGGGTLTGNIDSPEVYVGPHTGCTQFQRHTTGARASNLSLVRANIPAYPNIATVNSTNLGVLLPLLPRLTITNGNVNFTQLTNLLANPQCDANCVVAVRNLMSSTAGTAAQRATVASNQGLPASYAGVLNDYGVMPTNRSSSFSAAEIASIREILSLLPVPIVEMIHTIVSDQGMMGASARMGQGGDLSIATREDGGSINSMPMNDGTIIPGLTAFKSTLVHEIGHQVDANSPETEWRYSWLYRRGRTDPNARVGAAGGFVADRSEDFVGFWVTWFFDSRALLTQVQRRNNPVFSCKVAHIVDLMTYDSPNLVPYYKATAAGALQRLGNLNVTRSNTPIRLPDDGRITAIDGVAINCPRRVSGDFDGDYDADLVLLGASGSTQPVGFSNRDGTYRLTNSSITSFGTLAQTSGAKSLTGDFNNDGLTDMALLGAPGWTTFPIALSNGDGTFAFTNQIVTTNLTTWARTAGVQAVPGDFNGDGRTDIALTGGSGWGSIPIAFALGGTSFTETNDAVANFPTWATIGKALPGDFDADGKTDIALIGGAGSGWNSIPIAYSYGGGSFAVTNVVIGTFASTWAQQDAKPVAGDFDGDGRGDIALVGGRNTDGTAWSFLPVAYSNGGAGSFRTTNAAIAGNFGNLARSPGVKISAGDVDGDGKTDIQLTGGSGWVLVVTAFSNGDGPFRVVSSFGGNNQQFSTLAQPTNVVLRSSY